MSDLVRFGVSMEKEMVYMLDALTVRNGHPNRSETIRALVRHQELNEKPLPQNSEVTAVISLIHHRNTQLIRVPLSSFPSLTLSANLKMHLKDDVIIKILVISGNSDEVSAWAHQVTGQKQVIGRIFIAATDTLCEQLR